MTTTFEDRLKFDLSQDPIPSQQKQSRKQRTETKRGPGRPSNTNVKKEIKDEVEALILLMSLPVAMRDPECAGVLVQQSADIADAVAAIAMKNDALRRMIMSGGDAMMYVKLATALAPVGLQVYHHHFVKTEEVESSGGYPDNFMA